MMRALLSLALVAAALWAPAQTIDPAIAARSSRIIDKIRQVELLNIIMPIAMNREQIRAILPAIEKARENSRKIQRMEADDLAGLEKRLDEAVKAGLEQGKYPERDLMDYLVRFMRAQQIRRGIAMTENVDTVFEVVEKQLNEGQRKVMANIIDPRKYNPDIKEDLDERRKMRFFVSDVLLDPLAYDILVSLSRRQQ